MRVDLHNHTILCNHATGTVDEYIQRAIELGIDEYGFSDHAPMNFDPKYRMDISQKQQYEKWVLDAQEKYKDKIKVLLGYEVDYLDGFILDEVVNAKVDYLIGSVHFLRNKSEMWGFDNPEFIGVYKSKDIDTIWVEYFDAIKAMAKTGLFDIVGLFDLILSGMIGIHYFCQELSIEMHIYLCCGDRFMSQHQLYRTQVGSVL